MAAKESWKDGRHTLEGLVHRAGLRDAGLINLAPRVERLSRLPALFSTLTGVPVLTALIVILGIGFFFGSGKIRRERMALIEQAYREIEPFGPELDYLENTVNVLGVFEKERFSWIEVLSELNGLMPQNMQFEKLSMEKGGKMNLTGFVTAGTPIQIVEIFTTALEESPFFEDVQLSNIRPSRDQKRANFSISCSMADGARPKGD